MNWISPQIALWGIYRNKPKRTGQTFQTKRFQIMLIFYFYFYIKGECKGTCHYNERGIQSGRRIKRYGSHRYIHKG